MPSTAAGAAAPMAVEAVVVAFMVAAEAGAFTAVVAAVVFTVEAGAAAASGAGLSRHLWQVSEHQALQVHAP